MKNQKIIIFLISILFIKKIITSKIQIEEESCKRALRFFIGYKCVSKALNLEGSSLKAYKISKDDEKYFLKIKLTKGTTLSEDKNLFYLNKLNSRKNILHLIEYKINSYLTYEITAIYNRGNLETFINIYDFFEDQKKIKRFFKKLVETVGYMHQEKVIHTLLEPRNILINDENEPIIMEFEKAVEFGQKNKTRGVLYYMEPDQLKYWNSEIFFNEKVDTYSLGAILYYMVTKKHPYQEKTKKKLFLEMETNEYLYLPRNTLFVVAKIIEGCLQIERKKRFSIDDILSFLEDEKINSSVYKNEVKFSTRKITLINPEKITFFTEIILFVFCMIFFLVFCLYKFMNVKKTQDKDNNLNQSEVAQSNIVDKSLTFI